MLLLYVLVFSYLCIIYTVFLCLLISYSENFPSLLTVAHLSPTSSLLSLAFLLLSSSTIPCCVCVCSLLGAGSLSSGREATVTHTWDENLWRGLSHHCPLCINMLAQTNSFTLLHHQTGFCLSCSLNHTHSRRHTFTCKLITAPRTELPNHSSSLPLPGSNGSISVC